MVWIIHRAERRAGWDGGKANYSGGTDKKNFEKAVNVLLVSRSKAEEASSSEKFHSELMMCRRRAGEVPARAWGTCEAWGKCAVANCFLVSSPSL